LCGFAFGVFLAAISTVSAAEPATQPSIDPKAGEVLRRMSSVLQSAKSLSFRAHATVDQVSPDGQKVQYGRNQTVQLERPDKIAADVIGDEQSLQFRYDGQRVVLYNRLTNSWGEIAGLTTIDDTLDMLATRYGMVMPLADLAFADPYACLTANVGRGEYVGAGYVFDKKCHHLAFRQAAVDWQIWIEDGGQSLPLKVLITFKDLAGSPQYTAFLSDWKLVAPADKSTYKLDPPADAKHVEFAPATQPTQVTPAGTGTPKS
jgi:hypothetical protein